MGHNSELNRDRSAKLDGIKFWLAGDLGADYCRGTEWAEITFEPSVTKEQRDAIATILGHVYPSSGSHLQRGKTLL